jgi:flagellar export protein FliJ
MSFHFSLESLYRLRKSFEVQEERKLAQASYAVSHIRAQIESLDSEFAQNRRQWHSAPEDSNLGPALHFSALCEKEYESVRVRATAALKKAEEKRASQLSAYRKARQQREILAGLRTHQQNLFATEFARRQQRLADEMYLLRNLQIADDADLPRE